MAAEGEWLEQLREISGLSVDEALSSVGGVVKIYERIIRHTARLLPENIDKLDMLVETDVPLYQIEVHGIKSVLNNLGAYSLGEKAYELERLTQDGVADESCKRIHLAFRKELSELSNALDVALNGGDGERNKPEGGRELIVKALPKIRNAIDAFDATAACEFLLMVKKFSYGEELDALLEDLERSLERYNYEGALEVIRRIESE